MHGEFIPAQPARRCGAVDGGRPAGSFRRARWFTWMPVRFDDAHEVPEDPTALV